jgi:hypothetical protein
MCTKYCCKLRCELLFILQELIHHKAPRRHKLAVHVVSVAEGGAGLDPNVQDAPLDTEMTDELVPPPPIKEVSKAHLRSNQIIIKFLHLSTLKVNLTDFSYRWQLATGLHRVLFSKTADSVVSVIRTSNLTQLWSCLLVLTLLYT